MLIDTRSLLPLATEVEYFNMTEMSFSSAPIGCWATVILNSKTEAKNFLILMDIGIRIFGRKSWF